MPAQLRRLEEDRDEGQKKTENGNSELHLDRTLSFGVARWIGVRTVTIRIPDLAVGAVNDHFDLPAAHEKGRDQEPRPPLNRQGQWARIQSVSG